MSDRDASIRCLACSADNRGHRGYCRSCGAALVPVCRGCRFVNERGDRFCGGCGLGLLDPIGVAAAEPREATAAAVGGPAAPAAAVAPAGAAPRAAARPAPVSFRAAAPAPPPPAAPAAAVAPAGAFTGHDELAALLAPLAAARPADELPSAGITQADLDRLFGGTS
jgi:hypothetical protein